MRSFLLSCQRFSGSHTGTIIAAAFDDILETYDLSNKVEYILTDNASNMKSAFKVHFPAEDDGETADESDEAVAVTHLQFLMMNQSGRLWIAKMRTRSKIYLTVTAKKDYPALRIAYSWLLVMDLRKQNVWQKQSRNLISYQLHCTEVLC